MAYKILKSETVFQGRAFRVRHDEVLRPNGNSTTIDTVVHIGAVAMGPVNAEGKVILVRQYRHAARKALLELPAGTLEEGEPPEDCAQRELREEAGVAPGQLIKLGEFFLAPGYSTERMHIYLATGLRPESLPGDEDEALELETLSMEQAFAAVRSGQIEDAKTILGLFLARDYLKEK